MTESPGALAGARLGEVPYMRSHPGAALFGRRAERLRALAHGHTLSDYLELCARLAAAQSAAASRLRRPAVAVALPGSRPLRRVASDRREWRDALRVVVRELEGTAMPEASREALARLAAIDDTALAALAERVLLAEFDGVDLAAAVFVAAALQVQFTTLAAQVTERVARSAADCPLCGASPVAGVVLGDSRLRYLACTLCGSQWYLPRLTCARCGATGGLSYLRLEADPGEVKAEACASCKGYLKLFDLERRPAADPVADDLATLALDQLVAGEGFARIGVNLFLPV